MEKHVPDEKWLSPKRARDKYSLSDEKLKKMRDERLVTHTREGNKFLYSEDSLDALFSKNRVLKEPRIKIVERLVPIHSKGGANNQKEFKTKKTNKNLQGGMKMRWVKSPSGCVRLNCGDFSLVEYKRNGKVFYDMDFKDEEARHTKSLRKLAGRPIKDRTDAYETARSIRNAMYERQQILRSPDITFSEYLPEFLEHKQADKTIRYPEAIVGIMKRIEKLWFGNLSLREISQRTAEKYCVYRRKFIDDSTIDAEIGYLNSLLIQAKKDGYDVERIERSDLGLDLYTEREVYMTPETQKVIWPLLEKYPPMRDLADFILNTAMREINIIQLRWEDILWDKKPVPIAFVSKRIHKNKAEDGEYMLNPKILKMLSRRQAENGNSNLVFVRYESQNPHAITHSWIQRKWRTMKREANGMLEERGDDLRIPSDLRFYDLKATCLSRAANEGANEYQLIAISNHRNTTSLRRYVRKRAIQESALKFIK